MILSKLICCFYNPSSTIISTCLGKNGTLLYIHEDINFRTCLQGFFIKTAIYCGVSNINLCVLSTIGLNQGIMNSFFLAIWVLTAEPKIFFYINMNKCYWKVILILGKWRLKLQTSGLIIIFLNLRTDIVALHALLKLNNVYLIFGINCHNVNKHLFSLNLKINQYFSREIFFSNCL